jgi:hypothetical protein
MLLPLNDLESLYHIIKIIVHMVNIANVMIFYLDTLMPTDILGLAKLIDGLTRLNEKFQ